MRAQEIMEFRTTMSDIDMVVQGVLALKTAQASFSIERATASLRFSLDGNEGWLMVRAKPKGLKTAQEVLRSRIKACATSQTRGRVPRSVEAALTVLRAPIGPNAIKMLVGSADLELVALKWDTVTFGIREKVKENVDYQDERYPLATRNYMAGKRPVRIEIRRSARSIYKFYTAWLVYDDGSEWDTNLPGIDTGSKGIKKVRKQFDSRWPGIPVDFA